MKQSTPTKHKIHYTKKRAGSVHRCGGCGEWVQAPQERGVVYGCHHCHHGHQTV